MPLACDIVVQATPPTFYPYTPHLSLQIMPRSRYKGNEDAP